MMIDYSKWSAFISTLSNEEIHSQLADLFTFTAEYKALLEDEISGRLNGIRKPAPAIHQAILNGSDSEVGYDEPSGYAEERGVLEGVQLDFNVMNRIQSIIDSLTTDQLLDEMKNLDVYLSSVNPAMASDYQEKIYAKEACELKYFDLFGQEPVMCPNCLAYLSPEQRFCGKCGTQLTK